MTSHMHLSKISEQLKKVDPHMSKVGAQAKVLTEERMCKGLSMFTKALERIQKALVEADIDAGRKVFGTPEPVNGVMDIKQCNQFHRLWSVVMLVSCQAAAQSKQNTHTEWFGDGMQWAGCALIALMGQRERFEAFDFTYHIISAWELDSAEHKRESAAGIQLVEFVKWAKNKRALNDHIFAVFDRYPTSDSRKALLKKTGQSESYGDYIPPPGSESDRETDV
jgi:cytoplasmic FMR1 interacting protein